MISFKFDIPKDLLKIDTPEKKFWHGVGLEETREIRKRTETEGVDSKGQEFKPYNKAYAEYRKNKGRSTKPNLSFTGKMLGAMAQGIRSYRDHVRIILSGEQGAKAVGNEEKGRVFFELSEERQRSVYERVNIWLKKRNKLK